MSKSWFKENQSVRLPLISEINKLDYPLISEGGGILSISLLGGKFSFICSKGWGGESK